MIYCKKRDLGQYFGISPEMDDAIHIALDVDLAGLKAGRNEFSKVIFGNRFGYITGNENSTLYETHEKYADIHLLLSGTELAYVADCQNHEQVEVKTEDDYVGTKGEWEACVRMTHDDVLVVFPGETHKTKCAVDQPDRVEKLVIKVPIDRG